MNTIKALLLKVCSGMAIASLIAVIIAPLAGSTSEAQAANAYVTSLTLSNKSVTLIDRKSVV